jgi:hypothetical protein
MMWYCSRTPHWAINITRTNITIMLYPSAVAMTGLTELTINE